MTFDRSYFICQQRLFGYYSTQPLRKLHCVAFSPADHMSTRSNVLLLLKSTHGRHLFPLSDSSIIFSYYRHRIIVVKLLGIACTNCAWYVSCFCIVARCNRPFMTKTYLLCQVVSDAQVRKSGEGGGGGWKPGHNNSLGQRIFCLPAAIPPCAVVNVVWQEQHAPSQRNTLAYIPLCKGIL